ncbi:hypothetical protein CLAFUW4_05207 [Fulvia fulva]|uniref:Uncharacterized protein n=1 Tax=Passalora fulva TaxID=5499 RepID=A0A9Q8UUL2_PASFU|nr:uncharacterized protein CLAFUR5_11699 [Fulvia fulva]KAK4626705.1 hypothetical protein CLAFUR4_05193 [Fulvia fulva]KAK4628570.1 hypothetical protein CLAFUR0_05199 [Fulvia fulva]UJO22917.1 hypothetical protein CLAFUR5_11699 [Fulvia fulva]WPV13259.1 hypothetical protein CLAFUW4_05207 [Fulvia fulva]WPV29254.1 hypothetical protein CLAFUW7_05203 [Fulvia fulva]
MQISLSPEEEDTIIIPSDLLKTHSFWKASLGDQWIKGKTLEGTSIKRYELEFKTLHESLLVGKPSEKPNFKP